MQLREATPIPEPGRASMGYALDLFTKYLETQGNTLFTTLGYTDSQKSAVKVALNSMVVDDGLFRDYPPRVRYTHVDQDIAYGTSFCALDEGGFKMVADFIEQLGPNYAAAARRAESFKTGLPIEASGKTLAVLEVLPEGANLTDIDEVVRQLYNGAWANRVLKRNNPSQMSPIGLRGFIGNLFKKSQANYRAAWVDESTKLELVVETDAYQKLLKLPYSSKYPRPKFPDNPYRPGIVKEIWRRLPEITAEKGKTWVPFGKKPNPSQELAQRVLEGKKSKSFVPGLTVQDSANR